jgi:hypothetical protein
MLVRQHAGAPAPFLQQQLQIPRHMQHCTCPPAMLRRPQLAANTRHRQDSTGPQRVGCSAVAAPPAEQVDTVEGPSLDSATSGRRAVTAPAFPFVRIAGQEDMKLALLLNVIDPRIGGVLIMGDRGTGKSVAVSGMEALCSHSTCPQCMAHSSILGMHGPRHWRWHCLQTTSHGACFLPIVFRCPRFCTRCAQWWRCSHRLRWWQTMHSTRTHQTPRTWGQMHDSGMQRGRRCPLPMCLRPWCALLAEAVSACHGTGLTASGRCSGK